MSISRPSRASAMKRKASSPSPDPTESAGSSPLTSEDESAKKKAKRPLVKKAKSAPAVLIAKPKPKEKAKKVAASSTTILDANVDATAMPINKVLPTTITFPPREPGTLRLVTWNVAGLAASQKKGFKSYVEAEDPDILVLNETKVNNIPVDPAITARFPHCSWSISATKGYAGTAILSKIKPMNVTFDLPGFDNPDVVKGRIVTLEFPNSWVVGTYVPNAGEKLKNMDIKEAWNTAFEAYMRTLDATKPVIWLGDLNCAPTARDLKNDKSNWNKTAGYTAVEIKGFNRILTPVVPPASEPSSSSTPNNVPGRLIDVWREKHPDDEHYTYFSYRFNARIKGLGWRLDFFILSERLFPRVKMCEIRHDIWGASDHCPVVLDLEGEL